VPRALATQHTRIKSKYTEQIYASQAVFGLFENLLSELMAYERSNRCDLGIENLWNYNKKAFGSQVVHPSSIFWMVVKNGAGRTHHVKTPYLTLVKCFASCRVAFLFIFNKVFRCSSLVQIS